MKLTKTLFFYSHKNSILIFLFIFRVGKRTNEDWAKSRTNKKMGNNIITHMHGNGETQKYKNIHPLCHIFEYNVNINFISLRPLLSSATQIGRAVLLYLHCTAISRLPMECLRSLLFSWCLLSVCMIFWPFCCRF